MKFTVIYDDTDGWIIRVDISAMLSEMTASRISLEDAAAKLSDTYRPLFVAFVHGELNDAASTECWDLPEAVELNA